MTPEKRARNLSRYWQATGLWLGLIVMVAGSAQTAYGAPPARRGGKHPPASVVSGQNTKLVSGIQRVPGEAPWRHIVIHHTAVESGSLAGIHRYHKSHFGDELGIEYHFLVGNGRAAADGRIELGRWTNRARSLHVVHPERAPTAITIALMGNFAKRPPSQGQMFAVEVLVRRLMALYNIAPDRVTTHTRVDGRFSQCPGKYFPIDRLLQRLGSDGNLVWKDWQQPLAAVPMKGPYPSLEAMANSLRLRPSCTDGTGQGLTSQPMASYARVVQVRGHIREALLLRLADHRGCQPITRRFIGIRTDAGWYAQQMNGYRKGRLKVRRSRRDGHTVVLVDGRGTVRRCSAPSSTTPICRPAAKPRRTKTR